MYDVLYIYLIYIICIHTINQYFVIIHKVKVGVVLKNNIY